MNDGVQNGDERFLVLAPTGRDAPLTCALLAHQGLRASECQDVDELCARCQSEGAAGLLIAEEALAGTAMRQLSAALGQQESWSDIPILLFTAATKSFVRPSVRGEAALAALGNVTLIERPVQRVTILSAARAALRERRRQYLARAELLAQQRAVRQRDQFLAMLGHELRNPLSAIALANSLETAEASTQRQQVIGRQVQQLRRLVDDLLDVARVTSGKIVLQREVVELCSLAESTIDDLRPMMATHEIALKLAMPRDQVFVNGDRVRIGQIIGNLLTNAIKYTPRYGAVEVALCRAGDEAVLQICDSGIGIAPEMLERVFDLFSQAEGSLDRAKGGLGIGLTLVRNMVELHGGKVTAHSPGLDCGSRFEVRLPACAAEPPADNISSAGPTHAEPPEPSYQVLIVEDNEDSRELLRLILERLGHHAHAAEDGPSGVSKAIALRPDILLVDIGLPGLDGYGVARSVRDALGRDVYMVALTGYGQPDDRSRALAAGFDAHFTKPLDMATLHRVLHQRSTANTAN